jgi:hypothetical protein
MAEMLASRLGPAPVSGKKITRLDAIQEIPLFVPFVRQNTSVSEKTADLAGVGAPVGALFLDRLRPREAFLIPRLRTFDGPCENTLTLTHQFLV